MEELKKNYVSQVDSLKETLKFRVSSLENENSELQVISYLCLILLSANCQVVSGCRLMGLYFIVES